MRVLPYERREVRSFYHGAQAKSASLVARPSATGLRSTWRSLTCAASERLTRHLRSGAYYDWPIQ
jgi:hypothetical protein